MFKCQILGEHSKLENKNIIVISYRKIRRLFESNIERNELIRSRLSVICISSRCHRRLGAFILLKKWQLEQKIENIEKKRLRFIPMFVEL